MPLSEHVYCVAVTVKMTERVEQQICIKFCVKLEHSSTETIQIIQKATAMGNWWLAVSSRQGTCSCRGFFVKYHITQVTQLPYSSDLVACDFWLFLKLKWPLKGKRLQTVDETRKIEQGNQWQWGELCEVPRFLLWWGLRHYCPMYNVPCIFYLL